MKALMTMAAAGIGLVAAVPAANAAVLMPGATGVSFTTIDASTRGTLLDSMESGTNGATTYEGFLRSAVYRNTFGTLDFYYQVAITAIDKGDEVFNLTTSGFAGYTIDALVDTTNFDGSGIFTAAKNPNTDPNEPSGSTTTASRNGAGLVARADFGANGLEAAGQTSATYIFRTNAVNFNRRGTFTTQDGSTAQRRNFQPIGPAVPEPATWALMILGFGAVGSVLRRRKVAQPLAA